MNKLIPCTCLRDAHGRCVNIRLDAPEKVTVGRAQDYEDHTPPEGLIFYYDDVGTTETTATTVTAPQEDAPASISTLDVIGTIIVCGLFAGLFLYVAIPGVWLLWDWIKYRGR